MPPEVGTVHQSIDYGRLQARDLAERWYLAASFGAFAVSVVIAVWSILSMDGERLLLEGGSEYFRRVFPFALVIPTAAAGAGTACLALFLGGRWTAWAVVGLGCNVAWGAWWLWCWLG
jgi:hypothetical protein